tara:strand:+ start:30724 stop:30843 length:120 start_codon:yes stop_codon:yes gene_type:complete
MIGKSYHDANIGETSAQHDYRREHDGHHILRTFMDYSKD